MSLDNAKMIKPPFRRYNQESDKRDQVTVYFNKADRRILDDCKPLIQQERDGTLIRQLMLIGAEEVLSSKTNRILTTINENRRRNKVLGVGTFDQ